MSNVKVGDLAIVVHQRCDCYGRIVEVLYASPLGPFLVDGVVYQSAHPGHLGWVVKFVGGPGNRAPHGFPISIGPRAAFYDSSLRPLPGDTEDTTTEREVTA